ncbi:MAG: monovalent cation/H(+) antiporter subunit G [Pseudomonadota bacterium]
MTQKGRAASMQGEDLLLYIVGVLSIVGAFFVLVAAVGVLRLDDLYMRMHAASKAGTLGSGVLLIAIAVFARDDAVAWRAIAGVIFFLLTAPVSAHLLARAAYSVGYKPCDATHYDALSEAAAEARPAVPPERRI